jgi:hypothetical protein
MEPVIVIAIVFSAVVAIVKMSLDYNRWKIEHRAGKPLPGANNESLTTSELRLLIQDAMEEANAPIKQRLDQLEEHLDSRRALPPAS